MEWKALANAIIHDEYDPRGWNIIYGCEVCGNTHLHLLIQNEFPMFISDNSRLTIRIIECPECGHRELDMAGTYGLQSGYPDSIYPFIGHFFSLWLGLLNMAQDLEINGKCYTPEEVDEILEHHAPRKKRFQAVRGYERVVGGVSQRIRSYLRHVPGVK